MTPDLMLFHSLLKVSKRPEDVTFYLSPSGKCELNLVIRPKSSGCRDERTPPGDDALGVELHDLLVYVGEGAPACPLHISAYDFLHCALPAARACSHFGCG